jgi:uncharacterized repeat protein (TIGR01451 family)
MTSAHDCSEPTCRSLVSRTTSRRLSWVVGLLACFVLLTGVSAAGGAVITVTSVADDEALDGQVTLREAIRAASDDVSVDGSEPGDAGLDTIRFAPGLAGRTILLLVVGETGVGACALAIRSPIAIEGDPERGISIARAPSAPDMRLFYVNRHGDLALENVTLRDGLARGGDGGESGLIGGGGGGGAAGMGGAIYVYRGRLAMTRCTVAANRAMGGDGGGFPGRDAAGGGGGGGMGGPGEDSREVDQAGGSGGPPSGGDANQDAGWGGGGGGANVIRSPADDVAGKGGFGGGGGGGSFNGLGGEGASGGAGGLGGGGGGAGTSAYVGVAGAAGFGGGRGGVGRKTESPEPWRRLIFFGGVGGGGAGMGGAIFNDQGDVVLRVCTFSSNHAVGGECGSSDQGDPGAPGSGLGGAVFVHNGTLEALGCTFSRGRADQGGGAVFSLALGFEQSSTVTLRSSILAGSLNGATDCAEHREDQGQTNSYGQYNLAEHAPDLDLADTIREDPELRDLADNGGPVWTYALGATSPALDTGEAAGSATDARGLARTADLPGLFGALDGTDIGAFEHHANLSLALAGISGQVRVGDTITWTVTVTNPGPDPVEDAQIRNPLPPGLSDVETTTTRGTVARVGDVVTADIGTVLSGEGATITVSAVVAPDAGELRNTATVSATTHETSTKDNMSTACSTVVAGDGCLCIETARITIDWKAHERRSHGDTLTIGGLLNPDGMKADLTGATMQVTVNGTALLPAPLTLDRNGKGKTPKMQSLKAKMRLTGDGDYSVKLSKADLRNVLGLSNTEETGTTVLTVEIDLVGTDLTTSCWRGVIHCDYDTKQDKRTKGTFRFGENTTRRGAFVAASIKAKESDSGHTFSVKGLLAASGGEPIVPVDGSGADLILTIGNAAPIVVNAPRLSRSGTEDEESAFDLGKGAVARLERFTLDNAKGTFSIKSASLQGTGLPAAGEGDLARPLTIRIEIRTTAGWKTLETTVEVRRKSVTKGHWKN